MWTYNDNYLMHYGVKGMKWGVRKNPIRSGIRRFRTDRGESSQKTRKGLSDRQKTAIQVAGGAALIVGGTLMAHKLNKKLVATGGRSIKALADKQAMKIASSGVSSKKTTKVGRWYFKQTLNMGPSGRKHMAIRSTTNRLTGYSQLQNKPAAAKRQLEFYGRKINEKNTAFVRNGKEIDPVSMNRYMHNYSVARSKFSGNPKTSGNLGAFYRYKRKSV